MPGGIACIVTGRLKISSVRCKVCMSTWCSVCVLMAGIDELGAESPTLTPERVQKAICNGEDIVNTHEVRFYTIPHELCRC